MEFNSSKYQPDVCRNLFYAFLLLKRIKNLFDSLNVNLNVLFYMRSSIVALSCIHQNKKWKKFNHVIQIKVEGRTTREKVTERPTKKRRKKKAFVIIIISFLR